MIKTWVKRAKSNQIWVLLALARLFSPADGMCGACCLPLEPVSFGVLAGSNSFSEVSFATLAPGFSVANGIYPAWCVDYDTEISTGLSYDGKIYDSYKTNLPASVQNEPWAQVNYLLNHKQGNVQEIQNAIWCLLNQTNAPTCNLVSKAMVDDARAHGTSFVPTNGQSYGLLLIPQQAAQRLIFEITVQPDTNGPPGVTSLTSVTTLSNGWFRFQIDGQPQACYLIEGSTNFVNWAPVTVIPSASGKVDYVHTNCSAQKHQFFRALRQ